MALNEYIRKVTGQVNWLLEMFATLKENGKDQVIYGEMQEDVSLDGVGGSIEIRLNTKGQDVNNVVGQQDAIDAERQASWPMPTEANSRSKDKKNRRDMVKSKITIEQLLFESGGSGWVHEGWLMQGPSDRSKIRVCVKLFKLKDIKHEEIQTRKDISDQLSGMSMEGSSAIVRFFHSCFIEGFSLVVMEWCAGHNLQHWRVKDQAFKEKSPPLENLRIIAKQACSGLAFLHYIGYYHGDVSPKNIMWDKQKGNLKLIDYGSSVRRDGEIQDACTMVNKNYASKEVLEGLINKKSDVWSFGACLHFLLLGKDPWSSLGRGDAASFTEIHKKCDCCHKMILMCPNEIPYLLRVDEAFKFLLEGMLSVEHTARPTFDELCKGWDESHKGTADQTAMLKEEDRDDLPNPDGNLDNPEDGVGVAAECENDTET